MLNNSIIKDTKIQIYHEFIGNHTFDFHEISHITDIRTHIKESSPLYIYENFHFEHNNQPLYEYHQLSQILKIDTRLTVAFDPYDYSSSKHHYDRVIQLLKNPIKWIILNNRDAYFKQLEDFQQNFSTLQLQAIFQNPFNSIFLDNFQNQYGEFNNMIYPSGFNPVPNYRRYHGDLYYIYVKTLQQIDLHITASIDGFFVNMSYQNNYNPNPHSKYSINISLLDLLQQISPKFKSKFQNTLKNTKISQFKRILYNLRPNLNHLKWLKQSNGWKKSILWHNDGHHIVQQDEHIVKDWMQIFQFYRSTPSQNLADKINKQKIKYRVYKQFQQCATNGVMKIFNGDLKSINDAKTFIQQIFYFDHLLFYFVSDDQQHDLPKSQQINRTIINQHFLEQIQTQNLYLSNVIVVKYRGYKIVVRTLPNNFILQNINRKTIKQILNQSNSIENDQTFAQIIKKISKQLGLQSQNSFINQNGQIVQIIIHPEINGCITSDNKRILLNLAKLSPRDLNFQGVHSDNCYLRPQLMKIYNIKQKCTIPYNSMIKTKYKIPSNQKNKIQQKKLISLAKFAKQIMIPAFIDSFDEEMRKYLSDTSGITQNLHRHGLSSKYLGLIYQKTIEKKAYHIKIMIERVILIKSLKNLFRKALRQTPLFYHKTVIKHLLNCLYDQQYQSKMTRNHSNQQQAQTSTTPKKSKKKKNKEPQTYFQISFGKIVEKYTVLSSSEFWKQLEEISLKKFKHTLSPKQNFFQFQFSKTAILRDICLCIGINIQKRNYFNGETVIFNEQNILCMVPKVKLLTSQSKQLKELIEEGDKYVNKYQLQEAFEAYNKAIQFVFSVYNGIHPKLALINKKIADIYFKVGDIDIATLSVLNASEIYQHLLGQDHVQTIETFMTIGVYQFTRKKYSAAEFYILKALFLAKFSYSQCYPQVIIIYLNLSTVYQTQKKYTDAIMSLFMALNISIKIFGQKHLHTAIVFSALASLHYEIPDIQQCIKYQQKAINILQQNLGKSDQRVIEAKNVCQSYKNLQNSKKIKQTHQKQHKNMFNNFQSNKINFKLPFYDFRQKPSDLIWKKNKKMKYFL